MEHRKFINPRGIETKYFALEPGGAVQYGKMAMKQYPKDGPYTLVGTTAPAYILTPARSATVDSGIASFVIPTADLNLLSDPVVISAIKR